MNEELNMFSASDLRSNTPEVIHLNSAEEFLDKIRPRPNDIELPGHTNRWVYRGHNDAKWPLLPAAWRDDGREKLAPLRRWLENLITDRVTNVEWTDQRRKAIVQISLQAACEVLAVRQFCDLADSLGLLIPRESDVPDVENAISMVLNGAMGVLGHQDPLNPDLFVDIPFAFAQHHGIPTRYLDWTLDPLVAAFFATTGNSSTPIAEEICVWAADRLSASDLSWVRVPRGQHGFVHAQSGIFLFYGDRFGFPLSPVPQICLRQFTLPSSEAMPLRQRLATLERVSRAHLMPTLDNVAIATREKWDWLPK